MENMLKQEEGSEKGLFKLFHLRHFPKIEAYESIEEILEKEGVVFFFGDIDWMDQKGARNL